MDNASIPIPQPVNPDLIKDQFQSFYELITILRAECPWDKKQTHESISHLFIEEAYEMIDAIKHGNDDEFSKELGDLFLHIMMHAVIAEQRLVNSHEIISAYDQIKGLVPKFEKMLKNRKFFEIGKIFHNHWLIKKKITKKMTNNFLDNLYLKLIYLKIIRNNIIFLLNNKYQYQYFQLNNLY